MKRCHGFAPRIPCVIDSIFNDQQRFLDGSGRDGYQVGIETARSLFFPIANHSGSHEMGCRGENHRMVGGIE